MAKIQKLQIYRGQQNSLLLLDILDLLYYLLFAS